MLIWVLFTSDNLLLGGMKVVFYFRKVENYFFVQQKNELSDVNKTYIEFSHGQKIVFRGHFKFKLAQYFYSLSINQKFPLNKNYGLTDKILLLRVTIYVT